MNVAPVYRGLVKPSDAFILADQATSSKPASSSRDQAVPIFDSVGMGVLSLWRVDR
jgi:hypothetical protein